MTPSLSSTSSSWQLPSQSFLNSTLVVVVAVVAVVLLIEASTSSSSLSSCRCSSILIRMEAKQVPVVSSYSSSSSPDKKQNHIKELLVTYDLRSLEPSSMQAPFILVVLSEVFQISMLHPCHRRRTWGHTKSNPITASSVRHRIS